MKIAKLTTQKKRQDRFNIYAEKEGKEEYAFSVDEHVLVEWQLRKGMTLSEQEVEEIQAADQRRKVWNDSLHYLTHSMRTEYQVRQYLKKRGYEPQVVETTISRLKEYRFLQDEEYAGAFVRTKINTSDKGPAVIREDLHQKGVAADLAEQALEQYTPELQLETARFFLLKKGSPKNNESATAMQNRLLNALRRKGFSAEIAKQAWEMEQIERTEEEEMDAVFKQGEKALRKWKTKYEGYTLRMKIKETLYRKGFPLSCIDRYLEQGLEESEEENNEEKI
ncbi:recombination regulator RecX [Salibacterium aidingense]|uniref:recombination regulator RecX n=1 Tax=Salibacterium aidingense TaxID=384933 RepID=UPI00040F751E|nr:recombination regulator RecX [Salibacterium aidingense]